MQIKLSDKLKTFSQFPIALLKYISNFEYSEEKDEPYSLSISENIDSKRGSYLIVGKVLFQNILW